MSRAIYVIKRGVPGFINEFLSTVDRNGVPKWTMNLTSDRLKTYKTREAAVRQASKLADKGYSVRIVYYPQGL